MLSTSCCSTLFDRRHIVHRFNDLYKIYEICFCLQHATLSLSLSFSLLPFFHSLCCVLYHPIHSITIPFCKKNYKFLSLSVLIMLALRQHQSTFLSICPHILFFILIIYLFLPLYSFSTILTCLPFNTIIIFARGKLCVLFIYLCFQESCVSQFVTINDISAGIFIRINSIFLSEIG